MPLLRARIVGTPSVTLTGAGTPMALMQGQDIAIRAPRTGQKHVTLKLYALIIFQ